MTLLPTEFNIVLGVEGRAIAVAVSGDVDVRCASRLADLVLEILRADHRHLVVDLERAGAVDPVGLRTLRQAVKRCRSQGAEAELRLAGSAP